MEAVISLEVYNEIRTIYLTENERYLIADASTLAPTICFPQKNLCLSVFIQLQSVISIMKTPR